MLPRLTLPSLIVLPIHAGAGKTLVAGGIADWFRRRGSRVAVSVPVQTAAPRRREGLVSDEAEFLAACADAPHPLDLICPQRYADDLVPLVASRRADQPLDWDAIDRSIRIISQDAGVLIVQAPATLMTPLDERRTVLDLVKELGAPVALVTGPGLRRINDSVLTAGALRDAGASIAGIVINRYPTDTPPLDDEASVREIERWSKAPLLCVVPNERVPARGLPEGITGAIDLVDWEALTSAGKPRGGG